MRLHSLLAEPCPQFFVQSASEEIAFVGPSKCHHAIHLDWERRKERDPRLIARDAVKAETVFDNIYSTFRDEGFGREFDLYEKSVTRAVQDVWRGK